MSKEKESLILIINVGISAKDSLGSTYLLDKTKAIARCIIERKIFLRPKDEIGIIITGTNTTCNKSHFKNIDTISMQIPMWKMITTISNLKHTNYVSNWIETLYATIDYIKHECIGNSVKTIVYFSDFEEVPNINQFNANDMVDKLQNQSIQLLAIGSKSLLERSGDSITSSEKVFLDICTKVCGIYKTIDEALGDMRFIKKAQPNPTATSFTLEILDLQIPIKSYIKVTTQMKLPTWKSVTDKNSQSDKIQPDNPVNVYRHKEVLDRQREVYDSAKIVNGYLYGGVFTAFTAEDEAAMLYRSGPKCYKFLSMAPKDCVSIQYWDNSSSTRIILPANEAVTPVFYSLLQAMHDQNVVAMVRKVYKKDSLPNVVALFPRINILDEPWCFVEIKLPFAEDIRVMESNSLMSNVKQLSSEQNEMIDNFLDSFASTKINDASEEKKKEEFMPGCIPNPMIQHTYNMLSCRALNPEKPLPSVNVAVQQLLEPCKSIKEKLEVPVKKIKTLFEFDDNATCEITTTKCPESVTVEGQSLSVTKNSSSTMDNDSSEESVLLLDTSDIDIDQLVAGI